MPQEKTTEQFIVNEVQGLPNERTGEASPAAYVLKPVTLEPLRLVWDLQRKRGPNIPKD